MREVLSELKRLTRNKAPGLDGLPVNLMKDVAVIIGAPLAHIFNLFRVFPSDFKQGKITPVFKSGDKSIFNNYRPILVLSSVSNLLEKLVHKQFMYLEDHHMLSKYQFGFISKRSTKLAVTFLPTIYVSQLMKENLQAPYLLISVKLLKAIEEIVFVWDQRN